MTLYPDEPKTADELLARYRDVKRRLNPVSPRLPNRELPTVGAETILAFAPAAAVPTARALKSREQAERAQHAVRLAGACAHAGELPTESDRTDVGAEAQAHTQTAPGRNPKSLTGRTALSGTPGRCRL